MDRGYTEESMKMLESEEGQSNAIFACCGSAVQRAQLFEQSLTRLLQVYSEITADTVGIDDIGKRMTIGQLLKKVRQRIAISSDSVEDRLSGALEQRNFLIHRFFLERGSQLNQERGRKQLLKELLGIHTILDDASTLINAMRIAMCRAWGIEDDSARPGFPFTSDHLMEIAPFEIEVSRSDGRD